MRKRLSRRVYIKGNMHKKRGNILPLSIIMTLIILLAGIGIGSVVLEGSQQAAQTDQSAAAYYLADSGVERQLFEIRKKNKTLADVEALDQVYPNSSSWKSTSGLEQVTSKRFSTIGMNNFSVLDLFDPDNLTQSAGISSMTLNWDVDPMCPAEIEVSYAYWNIVAGVPQFPDDEQFKILPKDASGSMTVVFDNPDRAYRVRIKSYSCPASNVVAQPYDAVGAPKPVPGDITLAAEGTYGKATQKIAVTMPKLDVLSGLFGYVIFSECQLIKGAGAPVCP